MARTFYALNSTTGACVIGTNTIVIADETGPAGAWTANITSSAAGTVLNNGVTCLPADAAWEAANYDVTVEVTTANMNLTLDRVTVERFTSGCAAVATAGTLAGIGRSLGSTGSVTHTVSGSAQAVAVSGDILIVRLGIANGAMSVQTVGITVTITTSAFDAPAQAPAPPVKVIRQAVMRATLH